MMTMMIHVVLMFRSCIVWQHVLSLKTGNMECSVTAHWTSMYVVVVVVVVVIVKVIVIGNHSFRSCS